MNFYDAIRTRSLFISFLGLLVLSSCSDCFGYYQAEKGRWLSRDLVSEQKEMSRYNLLENDPVNQYDLFGLLTCQGTSEYGSDITDSKGVQRSCATSNFGTEFPFVIRPCENDCDSKLTEYKPVCKITFKFSGNNRPTTESGYKISKTHGEHESKHGREIERIANEVDQGLSKAMDTCYSTPCAKALYTFFRTWISYKWLEYEENQKYWDYEDYPSKYAKETAKIYSEAYKEYEDFYNNQLLPAQINAKKECGW